jgi:hypothetical protein
MIGRSLDFDLFQNELKKFVDLVFVDLIVEDAFLDASDDVDTDGCQSVGGRGGGGGGGRPL